jgi:hypothetical protein
MYTTVETNTSEYIFSPLNLRMKLVSFLSLFALLFATSFSFQPAKAYESDSHLRLTYLLCRAAGFNDATAKYLAYSNLYVDKSVLTSAMLHPAQRALFHFLGTFQKLVSNAHGGTGALAKAKELLWSRKISITERNHAVGSLLIYQGMVSGNLQSIGQGLHTKQDTYGHAGFTNAWGHMFDGHNPDRAFLETEKYEDMVRSVLRSLVAIRQICPEDMLDREGAINYLNNFSKDSHLGRNLTVQDLDSATTISSVILSSTELRKNYAENLFNNFRFKQLALEVIFKEFKAKGVINSSLLFEELFPESLIRDSRMDTADTIKAVIVADLESDFMKNKDGVDILNNAKLFEVENNSQLEKKTKLEQDSFETRLRSFEKRRKNAKTQRNLTDLEYQLEQEALQKEYLELSAGMNLFNVHAEIEGLLAKATEATRVEIERRNAEIEEKFRAALNAAENKIAETGRRLDTDPKAFDEYLEAFSLGGELAQKIKEEKQEMKRELLFEDFVKIRSRQLAELKMASMVADRLTKDFIPRKYTQYLKQAFETETYTRVFETYYKDEIWRRYFDKYFKVNWVFDDTKRETIFAEMIGKFKRQIYRKGAYFDALQKRGQQLLQRAARDLAIERIPDDENGRPLETRTEAQMLKYGQASVNAWNRMTLKYVGPAVIPFFGEFYLERLYKRASKKALTHETENIPEALARGKYSTPRDPVQLAQIAAFAAPAKAAMGVMSCRSLLK